MEALLDAIRAIDIAELATKLRPDRTCTVEFPTGVQNVQRGGRNVHIPVTFDDGVKWMARIRQLENNTSKPGMEKFIMESEVATQRALHEAGLKVPNAWHVDLPKECGLDMCFVEFVQGVMSSAPLDENPKPHLSTTLEEYARFLIKLSDLSFSGGIGSLTKDTKVGAYIDPDWFKDESPYFYGPFPSVGARYLSRIDTVLDQIAKGELFEDDPMTAYLNHLEMRAMILGDTDINQVVSESYVKHGDDKGDQVMVDEDGHITEIIDWELAVITSKAEAFAAPLAAVKPDDLFAGVNTLSPLEAELANIFDSHDRTDLGDCVRKGKKYQRLLVTVGQAPDWAMFSSLVEAMVGMPLSQKSMEEWCEDAKKKYQDDPGFNLLFGGQV